VFKEKKRLKLKKLESDHLVSQAKMNVKKGKMTFKVKKHRNIPIKQHGKINQCFFCKKMRTCEERLL